MIKNALSVILNNITANLPMADAVEAISDALDYVMDGGDHPDWFTAAPANIPGDKNKKALYELIVVRLDKPVEQMQVVAQEEKLDYLIRIALPPNFNSFIQLIKVIRTHTDMSLKEAKDIADKAMAVRPGWATVTTMPDELKSKAFIKDLNALGASYAMT